MDIVHSIRIAAVAGLIGSVGAGPAAGADRALLIGVGQFADTGVNPLPGIDLDIDMMESVARLLGFAPDGIKSIEDADASQAAVRSAFLSWLVEGVGPDDRVLVYFSGHGTRVADRSGDEPDGLDEALLLYDYRDTEDGTAGTLADDELQSLLAAIPSRQILVLLDACHSGTATRSLSLSARATGTDEGYVKYHRPRGLGRVSGAASSTPPALPKVAAGNYVSLAAARDDERSLATNRGSLFTLGVHRALTEAAQGGRDPTPDELRQSIADFIVGAVTEDRQFHPYLDGNTERFAKAIGVVPLAGTEGPNRERLGAQTAGAGTIPVRTLDGKDRYAIGERLALEFDVPVAGWLTAIAIDEHDVPVALMPNKYVPERRVEPGTYRIPDGDWPEGVVLQGTEPGKTAVVVLVTERPLGVYASADGQRDVGGRLTEVFGTLSPVGSKALDEPPLGAGWLVLDICAPGVECR